LSFRTPMLFIFEMMDAPVELEEEGQAVVRKG
jgi:hypothetical protein